MKDLKFLSKNLKSILVDLVIIDKKLVENLEYQRTEKVINPISPFISYLLILVLKYNRGWKKIHYHSYPVGYSINNYIHSDIGEMRYT